MTQRERESKREKKRGREGVRGGKKCWENKVVNHEIMPPPLRNLALGLGSQAMISIPLGVPLIHYFKVMALRLIYLQLCLMLSNISLL